MPPINDTQAINQFAPSRIFAGRWILVRLGSQYVPSSFVLLVILESTMGNIPFYCDFRPSAQTKLREKLKSHSTSACSYVRVRLG